MTDRTTERAPTEARELDEHPEDKYLSDQDCADLDKTLQNGGDAELVEAMREAFVYRGVLRAIREMIDGVAPR